MQNKFGAIFFLPQYSPQYAPVENFFSVLKSNLCSKLKGKYQESHSEATLKTIKGIESQQILNMWSHNFNTLNEENRAFIQRIKNKIEE